MNDTVPILKLEKVSKEYPSAPAPIKVLDGIDLTVGPGECLAIVGPSGSGKSTLLNLMGALDVPTSGKVTFKDSNIATLSSKELAHLRNRQIGFVFQFHHLLPQCTALENVLIPTLVDHSGDNARKRAISLLDRVGLGGRLDQRPGQLSGGERQRVAVVRALINNPGLLLADEPTGSLNQEGADDLAELLLELNREQGMALVVVTHSLQIAEKIGRISELQGGHLTYRE